MDNEKLQSTLKQLFPNGMPKMQRLEVQKIKDYFKDEEVDISHKPFNNDEELKEFFLSNRTQLKPAKDMLNHFFNEFGVDYNERISNRLGREVYAEVFFNVFNVYPKANEAQLNKTQPDNTNEPDNTAVKIISDVEQHKIENVQEDTGISALSKEELQDICDLKDRRESVDDSVDIANCTLQDKMGVSLQDKYELMLPDGFVPVYMERIVLLDDKDIIAAMGRFEKNNEITDGNSILLTFTADKINYDAFRSNRNFKLAFFPADCESYLDGKNYSGKIYIKSCTVDFAEPKTVKNVLCIDFGTSNTTAGTYGIHPECDNKPEIVKFLDVTSEVPTEKEMLPTIVYVDSCQNNMAEYSFGYEAQKKIIAHDYNPKASVFHEIKRWINTLDKTENIYDEKGYKMIISRKEILKAYIQHVIDLSEQYFKVRFKTIHFSAPVKLKNSFLSSMADLFAGKYKVMLPEASLDEGVAIIYNHIQANLDKDTENNKPVSVMIIDCGGGTTDLASCKYEVHQDGFNKKLEITTAFENGDSNFGGNNITFRILQILKIKLAKYLIEHRNIDVQSLVSDDENIMLDMLDKDTNAAKAKIYADFDKAYTDAEDIVPTRFSECRLENKKHLMKRNYYYLWQMAEAIKIEFYKANLVSVNFNMEKDVHIFTKNVEQYYLTVKGEDGNLIRYNNPMKDIDITIKEISRAIFADIYAILNNLLAPYDNEVLLKYKYKLSGQSCNITLFHELLKEFVPGKRIRDRQSNRTQADRNKLKINCIRGSIMYMRDKEFGIMEPEIKMEIPNLIYSVYREGDDKPMLEANGSNGELQINVVGMPLTAKKIEIIVQDKNGVQKRKFPHDLVKATERLNLDDLKSKIAQKAYINNKKGETLIDVKKIIDDIPLRYKQNKNEPCYCVFAVPAKNGYGMNIFQIGVNGSEYYLMKDGEYENFEDETLETFFDGKR